MLLQETWGAIVHLIGSRVDMQVRMGRIPNAIVEHNFKYIIQNYFHKEYAAKLVYEWDNKNINFKVKGDLAVDGEINYIRKRKRGVIIKLKKAVVTSKIKCWRRAIVCHELVHALHYFETQGQISKRQVHGKVWKKILQSSMREGIFKICVRRLVSPPEQCIYKQKSKLCSCKDKEG